MFINLTDTERDIIIGSLLGDANINRSGGITFGHSQKHNDYLTWKHSALSRLSPGPIAYSERFDPRHRKIYKTCRFYLGHGIGKTARTIFYPDGKKCVPRGLILHPLTVAIWILDDGSVVGKSSMSIATNAFSNQDILWCCEMLGQLQIVARPNRLSPRITIPAKDSRIIRDWILPIVADCPSMSHKCNFRPEQKLVGQVTKNCPTCQNSFDAYASANQVYCSPKCAGQGKPSGYITRHKIIDCVRCGTPFMPYIKKQERCLNCVGLRIHPVPCVICQKPVHRIQSITCSRSCNVSLGHRRRCMPLA